MSSPETDEHPTRRRRRLRRRARKNLRTALAEAGDQLTTDWVLQDRDLKTLRAGMREDPNWAALIEPAGKAHEAKRLTVQVPAHRKGSVTVPRYPWHPVLVISFWLAAILGFGYLFLLARADDAARVFIVLTAIATITSIARLVFAIDKLVVRRSLVWRRPGSSPPPPDPPAEKRPSGEAGPRNDETAP